jgi:uncharacterized membrane protein
VDRGVLRVTSRDLSLVAFFAALYAVGVVVLAPISFGIYQVRLADALLPLSMLFGLPCAVGLSLGAVLANVYGGLGVVDVVGGAVANLLACSVAWYVARRKRFLYRLLGCSLETLVVTLVVGGYLAVLFNVPVEYGLVGVFVGSVVAINVVGFSIEEAIHRSHALGT